MWLTNQKHGNFLSKTKNRKYGKNFTGKITVRHRGGSQIKPKTILIDYTRFIWNLPAVVRSLEKNFFYSSYLACVVYPCGILAYINAPLGLKPGAIIETAEELPIKLGNSMLLKNIPLNIKIHNLESFPKSGAKFVRAAGTFAKILEKRSKTVLIVFGGGQKKPLCLSHFCLATIGRVSNTLHRSKNYLKKAGDSRLLNRRPHVRGIVMNPVDHPHGGGKGKKSPKNPNYNFVRKLIKGKKTSNSW